MKQTGHQFTVIQTQEAIDTDGMIKENVITLTKITDVSGELFDLQIRFNLGHATSSSALISAFEAVSSNEIARQTMESGALVSTPIIIPRAKGIFAEVKTADGKFLKADDPNIQTQIETTLDIYSRAFEIVTEALTGEQEHVTILYRTANELVQFQTQEYHSDMEWLNALETEMR